VSVGTALPAPARALLTRSSSGDPWRVTRLFPRRISDMANCVAPWALILLSAAALSPCACGPMTPPPLHAASAPTCSRVSTWQQALGDLRPDAVLQVNPSLFWDTCAGVAQVQGVTIVVIATPDSALRRLVDCGSVQLAVEHSDARAAHGGLGLPVGLIEVESRLEGPHIALTLSADRVAKNVRLYREANTLAGNGEPRH
jgi:hypothetical protein